MQIELPQQSAPPGRTRSPARHSGGRTSHQRRSMNTRTDKPIQPTGHPTNPCRRALAISGQLGAFACLVVTIAGCGKQPTKAPEISLVRVAVAESLANVRSSGEASYLAMVKFDHETDLNFKVGGIVVSIGPAHGTDWDEGTPVKAGTVLAELKQSDFKNALDTARAKAELAGKTLERFRKLRATDAISQQELDVTEAEWRTAQAAIGPGGAESS